MATRIWDEGQLHSVHLSCDGQIAVLTSQAVHVYIPSFRHSDMFDVKWFELRTCGRQGADTPSISSSSTSEKDLVDWLSLSSLFGETRVKLQCCAWTNASGSRASRLCVLASDGTLVILATTSQGSMTSKLYYADIASIYGFGFSLFVDITETFQEWNLNRHPHLHLRIQSMAWCSPSILESSEEADEYLFLVSGNIISVWVDGLVFSNVSSLEVGADSTSFITCISVGSTYPSIKLCFGMSDGSCGVGSFDLITCLCSVQRIVSQDCLTRARIDRISFPSDENDPIALVVAGPSLFTFDINSPSLSPVLLSTGGELLSGACLCQTNHSISGHLHRQAIISTVAGDMLRFSIPLSESQCDTSRVSGGVLGMAVDKFGLVLFLSTMVPVHRESSRESQSNCQLQKPHCRFSVDWYSTGKLSPSWACVQEECLRTMDSLSDQGGFELSSFALALMNSIQYCQDNHVIVISQTKVDKAVELLNAFEGADPDEGNQVQKSREPVSGVKKSKRSNTAPKEMRSIVRDTAFLWQEYADVAAGHIIGSLLVLTRKEGRCIHDFVADKVKRDKGRSLLQLLHLGLLTLSRGNETRCDTWLREHLDDTQVLSMTKIRQTIQLFCHFDLLERFLRLQPMIFSASVSKCIVLLSTLCFESLTSLRFETSESKTFFSFILRKAQELIEVIGCMESFSRGFTESCPVCDSEYVFKPCLPQGFLYGQCGVCNSLLDRCHVTMLPIQIGFESVSEVLRCTLCKSVVEVHPELSSPRFHINFIHCIYCGILMQSLLE